MVNRAGAAHQSAGQRHPARHAEHGRPGPLRRPRQRARRDDTPAPGVPWPVPPLLVYAQHVYAQHLSATRQWPGQSRDGRYVAHVPEHADHAHLRRRQQPQFRRHHADDLHHQVRRHPRRIAKANKVTLAALQKANPTADSNHLKIGQKITIPAPTPATPHVTTPIDGFGTLTPHSAATTPPATTRPTTYTVKSGDNLRKIAKAIYGDEAGWKKIYRANRSILGDDPDTITIGMKLRIPQ